MLARCRSVVNKADRRSVEWGRSPIWGLCRAGGTSQHGSEFAFDVSDIARRFFSEMQPRAGSPDGESSVGLPVPTLTIVDDHLQSSRRERKNTAE